MTAMFRERFGRIQASLTRLDDQPLGKAALVIILFLDLFILISIFDGLGKHTRQLTSPDEHIPLACRQIMIDQRWNATNRMDNLSAIVLSYHASYYRIEKEKRDLHPLCTPAIVLLDQIKQDKDLANAFEDRGKAVQETRDLQREIGNLQGAYDTSLLESVAGKKAGQAEVSSLRTEIRQKTGALDALTGRITSLEQRISGNEAVRQLWERIQTLQDGDREELKADLRRLNFWFPVKRLGMQLVFLLPLFGAFYAWNSASIRKGRGVQTLVSSHLLIVASIPVLFKVIEAVYDIIPRRLLQRLMDLLESLKLVAIWHYLVIALAVTAALLLIYLVQKKLFSRDKLIERRIGKGLCQQCGKQLPTGSSACPFCGFVQVKACGQCGKATPVYGRHCRECGSPMA